MRMPTAVKTIQPAINVETVKGGPIVPYRSPSSPQVITPKPIGTYSKPSPSPVPKPNNPDIIDAEIVKSTPVTSPGVSSRRPVTDVNGRPSSQSARAEYYPQYPNPADGWRSTADFIAWQNGRSRESLDAEREAYEFTKDWGKTGGVLYPFTENGPRTPIISENFTLANRFRARHGLPSIDRFGYEQSMPINPSNQPGRGFSSNPFKTTLPNSDTFPATPSNFPEDPYNWDIDPDTGKPFTDLQKERGRELGRPAWHIDPTTGNPWGSDETGTPVPNPFQGYPGGSVRYPVKEPSVAVSRWAVPLELSHSNPLARGRGRYIYYVDSVSPPSYVMINDGPQPEAFGPSGGTSYWIDFLINGVSVGRNGNGDTDIEGGWEVFGVSFGPPYPVGFSANPNPGGDLETDPIGSPLPQIQPNPSSRVSPEFAPPPTQDPRVNPTPAPTLPGTQSPTLPENPNTLPVLPRPVPVLPFNPLPSIPGQPSYAPMPQPFPRSSPTGQPQPSNDPQNQPLPARPATPAPSTTTDRNKKPPVNPGPNSGSCPPCADPCEPEPKVQIRYKKFIGCNVTATGAPDRFREEIIEVPASSAPAIKSMLNSLADIQAQECEPCCYWDIEVNDPVTLFVGIPNPIGQDFAIAKGIARVDITYNAIDALNDNTLRNMKRIPNDGNPENTFVNVAMAYLISEDGMAIATEQIWTVGTSIEVPFEYRTSNLKVRLMPRSTKVNFSIVDSGRRWVQKKE